ncbi:MAG: O-antigen ligase family protein [Anaerolineaceae bacterium]|nr:O-antigen ligase family protein [Anaerolineaceae bacterium]
MKRRRSVLGFDWTIPLVAVTAILAGLSAAISIVYLDSALMWLAGMAGIGVLIGTLLSLDWGLCVLIFIGYTRASDVAVHYYGAPSIITPYILLLVGLIVLRWMVYRRRPEGWEKPSLLVGLYGITVFLSVVYADAFSLSVDAMIIFAKDAMIAIVIAILVRQKESMNYALWALMAAGAFLGLLSIIQYTSGNFSSNFGGFADANIMHISGESHEYRIMGTFGDPNAYAQIMVAIVPLAIIRFFDERKFILKALAGFIIVISVMTVVLTFSRGGFISLVMVLGLCLLWWRPPFFVYILIVLAVIVVLPFLPAEYTDRIATLLDYLPGAGNDLTAEYSFRGRISEYMTGILMFLDHPIIGVGKEHYPLEYQNYSRQLGIDPRSEMRSPHSLFIEVLAEQGILGFGVFLLLLFSIFFGIRRAHRQFSQAGLPQYANMAVSIGLGIAGYFSSSIFLHASYPRNMWILVGLALGISEMANREFIRFQVNSEDEKRIENIKRRLSVIKKTEDNSLVREAGVK